MQKKNEGTRKAKAWQQRAETQLKGLIAEFETDARIVEAAKALKQRDFHMLNGFTPRPVEELQALLAPVRSTLPRTVFIAACIGALTGLGVQWWCNAIDFPINVGGRPPFSLPAFIPITFELLVLFASLTAFFGVLHRARLPWLAHPVFELPGFENASIDRFWLFVSAEDPAYDAEGTRQLLLELGALQALDFPCPDSRASQDPALLAPREARP